MIAMVTENKASLLAGIAFCVVYTLFFSVLANFFNHLSAVDNAEQLPVDLSPWWQQINYLAYALLSLIPTLLLYPVIRELFAKNRVRFLVAFLTFSTIVASGVYGTAVGTMELQAGHLKSIEFLKQRAIKQNPVN